jgi:RNA polymerase-binding transcription factor DksA
VSTFEAAGQRFDTGQVRARLDAERERIRTLLAETESANEEGSEELSTLDQHPAELGTETFDRESALSLREQLLGELEALDDAERRLDGGTYGRCEACGQPIDAERLGVMPAARLCLDDQRLAEAEAAAGGVH